jgi:hypothetical protein
MPLSPEGDTQSLNGPERECFPGFYAGIPVVKKVELAMVTGPGERDLFSESQAAEGTRVGLEFDLNEYAVLAALLSDRKDFSRDGSHRCHFPGLASPETLSAFNQQDPKTYPNRSENLSS